VKSSVLKWLALAAGIVITAGALLWGSHNQEFGRSRKLESPLAVIPPGAALVASLDLSRLGASPAGAELVKRGATILGLGSEDCAARTLQRTQSIALSVEGVGDEPAHVDSSELALIASGEFDSAAVARCAEQTLLKRKGRPVRTTIGSFVTVRDQRGPSGEVAVRDGGPLVISNGRYLREILESAEGKPRTATELERTRDALHAELRNSFGRDAPVIATITLPGGWLERMLADREARLSPLSELRSAALRVEPAGDGFVLEALLTHGSPEAASQVEALLTELAAAFRPWLEQHAGARVAGQLSAERSLAQLKFSVHLTREELERLLSAAAADKSDAPAITSAPAP
jgi:hypothetical protein